MVKHLDARALKELEGQHFMRWFVQVSPDVAFADLFQPTFWAHHRRLAIHDIVRVVAHDGSYDVDLTVVARPTGGAVMRVRPHYLGASGADAIDAASAGSDAARIAVVPLTATGDPVVRVEYLPACKWRVIGIDNAEVSRDHESEQAALRSMESYLKAAGLVMPSAEAVAAAKDEFAARSGETDAEPAAKRGRKARAA